eukprot:5312565-Prymnesium_polylepis.1
MRCPAVCIGRGMYSYELRVTALSSTRTSCQRHCRARVARDTVPGRHHRPSATSYMDVWMPQVCRKCFWRHKSARLRDATAWGASS